jgi:hypothetical protein
MSLSDARLEMGRFGNAARSDDMFLVALVVVGIGCSTLRHLVRVSLQRVAEVEQGIGVVCPSARVARESEFAS